jgi:hypothetical protein
MPGSNRQPRQGKVPFDDMQIGVADGATANLDPHLPWTSSGRGQLGQAERRAIDRLR